jgi:type VI secretion system protein ImpM
MSDDSSAVMEELTECERQSVEPGFYGKLPSKGDFVTRRLPQNFVEAWDTWLQNGIQTSQDRLGPDWLSVYMTSPIWRFALSAGVGGRDVMTGVMMPSVDRVGRYFPLTVAVPLAACTSIAGLPKLGATWYEKTEEVALAALADGAVFEDLDSRIQALGAPDFGDGAPQELEQGPGASGLRVSVDPSQGFAPDYAGLAAHFINQLYPRYCLWWTAGSERVAPSMLVSPGLPSMGAFVAFLDGRWRESGWAGGVSGSDGDVLDGII